MYTSKIQQKIRKISIGLLAVCMLFGLVFSGLVPVLTYDHGHVSISSNIEKAHAAGTANVWNATDWTAYDTITIDALDVDDDLTDFPVFVDLSDLSSTFWSTTDSASTTVGRDIRVTTDDGSPVELPRELVSASSTAQTGELWFKANSISSTTDTTFRIYFNGTTTDDYATSTTYGAQNVWTNNYRAVWHFQEDPSVAGTGGIIDSTGNGYNGTDSGGMSSGNIDTASPLGQGYSFGNTAGYYLTMGDPADGGLDFLANQQYSLSAWAKSSDKVNVQYLVDKRGTAGYQLTYYAGANEMTARNDEGGNNVNAVVSGAADAIFTGAWHYFVSGRTAAATFLYDNAVNHTTADATLANLSDTASFIVGANQVTSAAWDGSIDEVRVASTSRSDAWVSAEYTNQASTTDFYTVNKAGPAPVTFSGTLFSDEGSTPITSGKTIKLMVGTSTYDSVYSTTTDSGAGTFHFDVLNNYLSTLNVLTAWVDGDSGTRAALVYKLNGTSTDVAGLDLYQNHVAVRSEDSGTAGAVTAVDLARYDTTNDADIQFDAATTGGTALTVKPGNELYLWPNTVFATKNSLLLQGNADSGTDGSLELTSGSQLRMASGTLSIAGNFTAAADSEFHPPTGAVSFIATTTGKTISAPFSTSYLDLFDVVFNGSGGGWTFTDHATTTDLTITAGSVTVASGKNLTVKGDFSNAGTFTNNGTLFMGPGESWNFNLATNSGGPYSVSGQESSPRGLFFKPDGTKMYIIGTTPEINEYTLSTPWLLTSRSLTHTLSTSATGANWDITLTPDGLTMYVGNVNPPTIYKYTLGTAWDISSASYTGVSVQPSGMSSLYNLTFRPDGQRVYLLSSSDGSIFTYDLATPWTIAAGSLTYVATYNISAQELDPNTMEFRPDGKQLYVLGRSGDDVNVYDLATAWDVSTSSISFTGTPLYVGTQEGAPRSMELNPDGTQMVVLGNTANMYTYTLADVGQTLSGTLTGGGALGDISMRSASTTVFAANASTTDFTIEDGIASAPSQLSIVGDYTNNSVFKANSGEVFFSGTSQQTATGTLSGTSAFNDLTITNTSQDGSTNQSIIFGAVASSTGTFTMLPNTSAQFLASATNTFQNIDINGGSTVSEAWLRSSSDGSEWYMAVPGNATATFANIKDSNVCGSFGGGLTATSSTDAGNNTCWTIIAAVTGSSTISNHDASQVNNAFNFQNKTNEALFAFKLTPESGNATVTEAVVSLTGIKKVYASDFSNIRLYRDKDNDAAYDASDVEVGGAGVMTISDQSGNITFSTDFLATTSENYVVIADWNAPDNGSFMLVSLNPSGLTLIDDVSQHTIFGSVSSIQHSRNNRGGGGAAADIGGAPPAGGTPQTGGGSGGGAEIDTNTGGDTIGNATGFYWPSANSGSWTNAANAYDQTDGTYTTDNAGATNNFTSHSFGVPGTNQITGIEVKMEVSGTTDAGTIGVELSWNGGSTWTSSKSTPTLTTTDAVVSVGGSSDLWGRSWTPSEFSNTNFAVRLTGNPSSNTVQVDALQVRVYHQATGGSGGGGGEI